MPSNEQQEEEAHRVTPLVAPPDWPHTKLPARRVTLRLPIIGPFTFPIPQPKYLTLERMVEESLKSREITIDEAWVGHPELLEIVRQLQRILGEELWGFEFVFIPDDSYALLGQWLTGDLCEIEGMMAIEDHFGVTFPEDATGLINGDMLGLVRFIHTTATR